MAEMILSIPNEYSKFPAGRTPADGPFNGQRFREEFLLPALHRALAAKSKLVVSLDGAGAYSSSFLEEAFGGIVRAKVFSNDVLSGLLEIRAEDAAYRPAKIDAESYMAEARARA